MNEEDFFSKYRLAIIGLGLMGGSLALKLQSRFQKLFAIDIDPEIKIEAEKLRIVDQVSTDPLDIIPHSNVIIIASPVHAILEFIPKLPGMHPGNPIIMDLGSTKVDICKAYEDLPSRFEVIGGHPMCGKAVGGLSQADPNLYCSAPFALTPLTRTTERAYKFAVELADALGAKPVIIEPELHDRWVAVTSHLPYLVASALTLGTPLNSSDLIGSGFRSTTRLATSPSSVMLPVIETNRENVLESIKGLKEHLNEIEDAIERKDFATLETILDMAADHKIQLSGK